MINEFILKIIGFLSAWALFLFFMRVMHRYSSSYTKENTWLKDIIISLIQTVVVLYILLPILYHFISKQT